MVQNHHHDRAGENDEGLFDLSLIREQLPEERSSKGSSSSSSSSSNSSNTQVDKTTPKKASLSRQESDSSNNSSSSVPQLDSLTADTTLTTAADDDSSVSTLGSTMSASSSRTRRSVFSKYWNATGQKPLSIRRRTDYSASSSSSMISSPPLHHPHLSSTRRSIFLSSSHHFGSYGSLPGTVHEEQAPSPIQRKSTSLSDLGVTTTSSPQDDYYSPTSRSKSLRRISSSTGGRLRPHRLPLTSCLKRDPLYSSSSSLCSGDGGKVVMMKPPHEKEEEEIIMDDSASVASSVRFDMNATAIRLFETPKEVHADEGWSTFFH